MKYQIKMRSSDQVWAETDFLDNAQEIAKMLYKKYNGKHVIFVEEREDWTTLKGRYSFDGYKNYEEIGSE